jgi:hypothetical protein
MKRNPSQIAADRERIVTHITANDWTRPATWMRPTDIAALVDAGRIVRTVRKEYDRSTGHQSNMFGGAAVMVRRRAYLSIPEAAHTTAAV